MVSKNISYLELFTKTCAQWMDLLFFNDGLNPPKVINVSDNYGTSWKLEYILVAKAPPIMPPKVVYENDTTVNVNNVRNTLFQFCYRYVYDNNEK